ncbi:MAG: YfhO family protein [Salibacteraceae bacterium]
MDWKKLIPHAVAVVVMAIASLLYCSPVLEGKMLVQDDIVKNISQAKEARDFREANGEEALWTTRVFSGMTMFHIGTKVTTNVVEHVRKVLIGWLPKSARVIFGLILGFYLLQLIFGVNPWLALVMAIGYGLSSNLIVSLLAGHNTKVLSIAFMAPAIGAVILALNGKRFIGALLTMFFVGLMVFSNHYQIMYYFLLISLVIAGVYLYYAIKENTVKELAKSGGLLILAGLLALLPNLGKVYATYEHSKETIRGGKTELSSTDQNEKGKGGGLDKDYAMRWSYGPLETFTTVIPSFMGGATGEPLPEKGNVAEALQKYQVNKSQKEAILANAPMYVGDQPFLLGTVYFGAGFVFLFILSLFLFKGKTRAWVVGIIIMSLVFSWGRHIDFITGFLFDYFPMYNKFRTPSMALAIAGFAIPLFGVLGLHKILMNKVEKIDFNPAFKYTIYIAGGMMALLLIYGITNDWIGPKDAQYQTKNSPWAIEELYNALLDDRRSRFLNDWFISTLVMAATALMIWLYTKGKTKIMTAVAIIGLVYIADMWHVSKRYLNADDFISQREYDAKFKPSPASQSILADKDPHYRVVNVSVNPWTDGLTCYHHENIGGHHAAKLQRYQDLIENQLSSQLQQINNGLMQNGEGIALNPQVAQTMPVYNMLNTKYFIVQPNNPRGVARNPTACGNAWFVSNIKKVSSADEEMTSLSNFDPLQTAIVHEEFSDELYNYDFDKSANASIRLLNMTPKYLKYETSADREGLAVFSEIYYPQGWSAFINGEPAEIYRANYILRTMKIPAGENIIEMRFEPKSFTIGKNISLAGSFLFVLFGAGMLFFYRKQKANTLEEE